VLLPANLFYEKYTKVKQPGAKFFLIGGILFDGILAFFLFSIPSIILLIIYRFIFILWRSKGFSYSAFATGAAIFFFSYYLLSGFDFELLLNLKVAGGCMLSGVLFLTAFNHRSADSHIFQMVLASIIGFFYLQFFFSLEIALLFPFLYLPNFLKKILKSGSSWNIVWINFITAVLSCIYFIYIILYETYLIQALKG